MHVVEVGYRQIAVLGAYHAEKLRAVSVLNDLYDVALVGHFLFAVEAEGLGLQLIDAVGRECHLASDIAAVGHGYVVVADKFFKSGPLLVAIGRPGVGALAAVAQTKALQACILTVQVEHLGRDAVVLKEVILVEHGVIDRQVNGRG